MAENETTAAPGEGTTPASEQVNVGEFINEDGSFREGWQNALVPEDLRGLGEYKSVTDIRSALKQLGTLSRLKGRKGIIPPGEDATASELDVFYEALGRPKTPDDYKVEIPDDLKEFYDEKDLAEARSALHKAGLNQKQVAAVIALDAKRLSEGRAKLEGDTTVAREVAEKALRTKWGDAYEEKLHVANRVIAENAGANKDAFLAKYGNDPLVAELLAEVGSKFMEGKIINTDSSSTKMTPGEAKLRLSELASEMAQQPELKSINPAKYVRLSAEMDRLAEASLAGQQQ
jgi:hypothetical protein